jgi:hypothetical protein
MSAPSHIAQNAERLRQEVYNFQSPTNEDAGYIRAEIPEAGESVKDSRIRL